MPNNKIEKLKRLIEVANEGINRKDFLESFKTVVNQVLKLETKTINKIDTAISEMKNDTNTLSQATQADLSDLYVKLIGLVDTALKEQENGLNFIKDKVSKLKNGRDGRDGNNGTNGKSADENKILEVLEKKLPKIDSSEIKKLKKEIEELKKRPSGGGGTSAIGVAQTFKYIAHTEKPSGTIDGANKVFTVTKNIFWVAGFTISNQQIAELPNFTYVGKTITFTEAIPAVYATKDFEIKFIGT